MGSIADFDDLAENARKLKNLHIVLFGLLSLSGPSGGDELEATSGRHSLLDPFLRSLSSLPKIMCVFLQGDSPTKLLGKLHKKTLAGFGRLKYLVFFHLDMFALADDDVKVLVKRLETSTTLTQFQLNCELGLDGSKALARLVRKNQGIKNLMVWGNLRLSDNNCERNEKDVAALLLRGVTNSSSRVEQFELVLDNLDDHAQTIQEILVQDLATKNLYLENVCLAPSHRKNPIPLGAAAQFYLHLNAVGRRPLLQGFGTKSDSRASWMDMLSDETVQEDLNAVFYFLSANPFLCNL